MRSVHDASLAAASSSTLLILSHVKTVAMMKKQPVSSESLLFYLILHGCRQPIMHDS
jgi:hypothetical protein